MDTENPPIVLWDDLREQVSNDCACSEVDSRTKNNPTAQPEYSSWQKMTGLLTMPLSADHTLYFNPLGQWGPVVLNQAGSKLLEQFVTPKPVRAAYVTQLAVLDLLHPAGKTPTVADQSAATLTVWLHVTNACNLRCTYCYIEKTEEALDEPTGRAAIETIFRMATKHSYRAVKLKYAGGEATLNFGLIQVLHEYAQQLAQAQEMALHGVILSNGVGLTNAMLDYMHAQDLTLMISLDGSAAEHDNQRVFSNGRGSYQQVTRSIDRAITRQVKPHLSITITEQSAQGAAQAVAYAVERGLLFNLNFYRQHTLTKTREQMQAEDEQLIMAVRAAFAVIEEHLPQQSLIGTLVDRSNFVGLHKHSCGAGRDYLVIDHKGAVASCQMEIERPVSTIFADDPLLAVRQNQQGFKNLSVDEKEGCRSCEWRYWCAGGCSLLTYRATGRNDIKSPYCNVYKALYPEMLRLEGLRLLKWQPRVLQAATAEAAL